MHSILLEAVAAVMDSLSAGVFAFTLHSSSDASVVDDDVSDSHCRASHNICLGLAKSYGGCVCEQFVLVTCLSRVKMSRETWTGLFTDLLEGVSSNFWGYEVKLGQQGDGYLCCVAVQVHNPGDHCRTRDLVEDLFSNLGDCELAHDFTRQLTTYTYCCMKRLSTLLLKWKNADSGMTFGNEIIFESLV